MMKVWITSFLVLFGVAELYQWVKHFTLPLPVYILGGAFLAIASNYERRAGLPLPDAPQADIKDQTSRVLPSTNTTNISQLSSSQKKPMGKPINDNIQSSRPISFTISKSNQDKTKN